MFSTARRRNQTHVWKMKARAVAPRWDGCAYRRMLRRTDAANRSAKPQQHDGQGRREETMFIVPKDAVYRRVSRRKFLELGGSAAVALGAGSVAVGLGSTIARNPVYAQSSDDAKWKQYS